MKQGALDAEEGPVCCTHVAGPGGTVGCACLGSSGSGLIAERGEREIERERERETERENGERERERGRERGGEREREDK